jgi:protein-tyrosine phosphatase
VSHADNASVIETVTYQQNSRNLPYMFDNLKTATEYNFKVRACSELTRKCGNWSEVVNGMTMDGTSSAPINLLVSCSHFNVSRRSQVSVQWQPPLNKNGKLISYHVVLDGSATYRSEYGTIKNETWGPKVKSVNETLHKALYDGVPPNTNYTISVSGITRAKRPGDIASATCRMPPTLPDSIGRFMWGKVKTETGNWVFKLFLPRISERNGPICCYRIYLVRMGANIKNQQQLPPPEDLEVMTYHEVHSANNTRGGAYLAEVLPSDDFHSKIFLGDGRNINSNATARSNAYTGSCKVCTQRVLRRPKKPFVSTTTTTAATPKDGTTSFNEIADEYPEEDEGATEATTKTTPSRRRKRKRRRRRQHDDEDAVDVEDIESAAVTLPPITIHSTSFDIYDGHLDMASNYTGFVEVIGACVKILFAEK